MQGKPSCFLDVTSAFEGQGVLVPALAQWSPREWWHSLCPLFWEVILEQPGCQVILQVLVPRTRKCNGFLLSSLETLTARCASNPPNRVLSLCHQSNGWETPSGSGGWRSSYRSFESCDSAGRSPRCPGRCQSRRAAAGRKTHSGKPQQRDSNMESGPGA